MADELKKLNKVVEGKTKIAQNGNPAKNLKLFVVEDFKNVGATVFSEVLFPQAKQALYNALLNGLSMVFWGASGPQKKSGLGLGTKINYSGISNGKVANLSSQSYAVRGTKIEPEDVEFETRMDAQNVLDGMCDLLENFERVTFAQMLELADVPNDNYTLNNYGWTNLRDAEIRRMANGKYYIRFPKMRQV